MEREYAAFFGSAVGRKCSPRHCGLEIWASKKLPCCFNLPKKMAESAA